MISSGDRKIAKNTVYLYVRTVLTLFVSLYTSRVVLEKLGASDFGVFNLVAGFLTIFAFLHGSAMSATQRYLTFELGAGNMLRLRQTFASALAIHLAISAVVVVLGETVGLWFVNTQLEIDPARMYAANWVYQLAIVSMVFTIVQIPYSSVLMSRERLDVYAVIMLGQSLLRLGAALAIALFAEFDTLIWYAVLYTLVSVIVGASFMGYAMSRFEECRMMPRFYKGITRDLASFSGYDTYGNFCSVARLQGMAFIINRFGGTVLNASAALATNVSSAFQSFSSTILLAFKPRMTKEYAVGNYEGTASAVYNCTRFALLLAGVMAVPLFFSMDFVLRLWLGAAPPQYTADFCRICVITSCADAVNFGVYSGIHATGRVRTLSLLNGSLGLVELVAIYLLLRWLQWAPLVYLVHLTFVLVCITTAAFILRHQMPAFSPLRLAVRNLLPMAAIIAAAAACCLPLACLLPDGFGRLLLMCAVSTAVCGAATYLFILDREMKAQLRLWLRNRFNAKSRN